MRKVFYSLAIAASVFAMFSCNKETPVQSQEEAVSSTVVSTKATQAYGDKTPKLVAYVETNSANPLNALDYYMSDGSQLFDIVNLFAANLHVDDNGDPCIYFNPELAPVMANPDTYIRPLQNVGIKVLLTILPDWQNMGLCSLTEEQAETLAAILAYIVDYYGLDGIDFDDEYEGNGNVTVAGSYANVIKALRPLLDDLGEDKLLTVFEYGHTGQIDAEAGSYIDYAYTDFTPYYLNTTIDIAGVTKEHWAPYAINLSYNYSTYILNTYVKPRAASVASNGYGAIMLFNLHESSVTPDPLSAISAIALGAYNDTITRNGGNRARTAGTIAGGLTITNDDI